MRGDLCMNDHRCGSTPRCVRVLTRSQEADVSDVSL